MAKPAKKLRPTKRTPDVVARIISGLRRGTPLSEICRGKGMPSRRSVTNWMNASKAFASRIARARDDGYDRIANDCLDIADDGSRDYKQTADGREVPDYDHISRSKLRIWTRLELLKKWDPKRYGDLLKLGDPVGNKLVPPALKIGLVGGPEKAPKKTVKSKAKRAAKK